MNRRVASSTLAALLFAAAAGGQPQPRAAIAADLQSRGDLIGAETELKAAVAEAGADGNTVETARSMAVLGIFYQDVGNFTQAEASFTGSRRILAGLTSPDDLASAPLIAHLAWLYIETGQTGKANQLNLADWIGRLQNSDPNSKYLPSLLEALGGLFALRRDVGRAEEVYRHDFELLTKGGADRSVEMASALNNFGFLELIAGRYSDASNAFSKAFWLWTDLSGSYDLPAAISRLGLAEAYAGLRRDGDSAQLLEETLPIFERKCGPNSLRTADVLTQYAEVLRHLKHAAKAKRYEMRASHIRQEAARNLASGQTVHLWDLTTRGPKHFLPRLDDGRNPTKASQQ